MKELKFSFKDYKGVPITYDDEYYYSLELRIEFRVYFFDPNVYSNYRCKYYKIFI